MHFFKKEETNPASLRNIFSKPLEFFSAAFNCFYLQVCFWDFFCRGLISQVFHPAAFAITDFCWPPAVSIQGYAITRGWDF